MIDNRCKKSASSSRVPDNHKPHDENDKFFLVVQQCKQIMALS